MSTMHDVHPDLMDRMEELRLVFGLPLLRLAMEQLEDEAKERSCRDDRPVRADNE